MILGIPKEVAKNETRVAVIPATVKQFVSAGFTVKVETNAGKLSQISDSDFKNAGAEILSSATEIFNQSDMILKVDSPTTSPSDCPQKRPMTCFERRRSL